MQDHEYKPDFEIAEKYISFSAEILRLSLLAITGAGSLLLFFLKQEPDSLPHLGIAGKLLFILTFTLFGLSTACSLAHRFFATDSLSYLIARIRKPSAKDETKGLHHNLKSAERMLIITEWLFGIGVFAFICSFTILVLTL